MANNLTVTISAVDKATETIRKINASMNGMVSPLNSVRRIGAEVAKNPAIQGLKNMGSAAMGVGKALGAISGPMLGVTGLGVVAGLAEITAHWARMGREISNTSTSLGMTTKGLVTVRGAAQMVGLSSEQADSGLDALRQTLQDARWGRNPALIGLMSRLGMTFRYTKNGALDVEETMKDVADMMATQKDVGAKHTIAQAFGLDGLFPLLNEGRTAIEKYQKQITSMAGTPSDEQIARNKKFAESIALIKASLEGGARNFSYDLQGLVLKGVDFLKGFGLIPAAPGQQSASGKIKPLATPLAAPQAMPPAARPVAPLGIRNNNPMNLMPGGRESAFPTMEAGIGAAMRNLMSKRYFGGGNDTAADIINVWSPANAPGNSPQQTANYISAVQSDVGTGHLNPNDPATMAKLLSSMIRQENGAGTYDAAKMDDAIKHVVVEFKNAPPGTTATARTASGNSMPVRVVTAMPAMGAP
jgi:hypothetical protein